MDDVQKSAKLEELRERHHAQIGKFLDGEINSYNDKISLTTYALTGIGSLYALLLAAVGTNFAVLHQLIALPRRAFVIVFSVATLALMYVGGYLQILYLRKRSIELEKEQRDMEAIASAINEFAKSIGPEEDVKNHLPAPVGSWAATIITEHKADYRSTNTAMLACTALIISLLILVYILLW